MKKIIACFIFCFLCDECFSQAGEWVWIKGDSIPNQPGNFGVQGVPSPTNNPPGLYEACEWTDLNGNFWLFGGYDLSGSGYYNDLWKYDPTANIWVWMKGSSILNDSGSFGLQSIASPTNNPPALGYGAASWVDTLGNLWLFGGYNYVSVSAYHDLWKYNISTNEWTWMKGTGIPWQIGVYGTQGTPSPANNPGARCECATAWTDNAGDLWFFGGCDGAGCFNDLWRYNIASNQWTWMKGSQNYNQPGTYGTMGIENTSNSPGARGSYSHWKDNTGKLWLFGGLNFSFNILFNDLWRFNYSTNNWAWISGLNNGATAGIWGTQCVADSNNLIWNRLENRAAWSDHNGNFWVFGGATDEAFTFTFNDLWIYCISTNQWIWENGNNSFSPSGNWGTLGVSNPANKPDGRAGSVGWTDQNGHLYLFGGATAFFISVHNDLWRYTIDTSCTVCHFPNNIQENNPPKTDELLVFPNPANSSLSISFQSYEKQNIELRMYNMLGKEVYFSKEEIVTGKFEKEINVKTLSNGIYFLQVKMMNGALTKKVLVY